MSFCKEMRAQIKDHFSDKLGFSEKQSTLSADNLGFSEKPTLSERNPFYLIR